MQKKLESEQYFLPSFDTKKESNFIKNIDAIDFNQMQNDIERL